MNIIPALNCLDAESLGQWLAKAGSFLAPGNWIHLDISDGKFTPTKTWNEPDAWQELAGRYDFNLEVHLMVEKPEEILEEWLGAGAQRAVIHVETIRPDSWAALLQLAAKYKAEIVLSSCLDTPFEALKPYLRDVTWFQVLAVYPGLSGQKFLPSALEKVKLLRALRPNAKIEVDGGINPETAKLCKDAGADFVAAASYIFWGEKPKEAWEELKEVASG